MAQPPSQPRFQLHPQPQLQPHLHVRTPTHAAAPIRSRASKACRRCHEKRVKCDASERGTPCTRCQKRQEPDCRLIESRRGIYTRKQARRPPQVEHQVGPQTIPQEDPQVPQIPQHCTPEPDSDPRAATPVPIESPTRLVGGAADNLEVVQGHVDDAPAPASATSVPAPEHNHNNTTPSDATNISHASSYREISWGTTFDHLLKRRHDRGDVLNKYSITYVGEAFPLGIVLKDLSGGSDRPLLHHPGPPCQGEEETAEAPGLSHPPGMRPEEIAFLEAKDAFTAPSDETIAALIDVFFERVFPIYPIVNPQELLLQHTSRRIPWMLLHALCFIAATYCPIRILYRAGFDDRTQARSLFYDKAKALFDIGYEGNKIVALQVSILLSCWGGGGPSNYWNFYTWICTGVTIAETLGFHRSMARANIEPQDRSLIKRLWWTLVIRDVMCSSLVGRPIRINLNHCDVEHLTEEDFSFDVTLSLNFMRNREAQCYSLYQIHATKLALILHQIIAARFYPRKQDNLTTLSLHQMLTDWRSQLPAELKWSDHTSTHQNVFVSTLCILYNHNMILAHVNRPMEMISDDAQEGAAQRLFSEDIASNAARQIASCSCAVVTRSEGLLPPQELFHGLFIASVIFYLQTKSRNPITAQLGMSGVTNCKMALHATRETWDASPWISQLFDKVLCISAANTHSPATQAVDNVGPEADIGSRDMAPFDLNGFSLPGYDAWPSHLFLGNLLDATSNATSMPMTPGFRDRTNQMTWF